MECCPECCPETSSICWRDTCVLLPGFCTHLSIPRLPHYIEGYPLTTLGSPHHASFWRPGLPAARTVVEDPQEDDSDEEGSSGTATVQEWATILRYFNEPEVPELPYCTLCSSSMWSGTLKTNPNDSPTAGLPISHCVHCLEAGRTASGSSTCGR